MQAAAVSSTWREIWTSSHRPAYQTNPSPRSCSERLVYCRLWNILQFSTVRWVSKLNPPFLQANECIWKNPSTCIDHLNNTPSGWLYLWTAPASQISSSLIPCSQMVCSCSLQICNQKKSSHPVFSLPSWFLLVGSRSFSQLSALSRPRELLFCVHDEAESDMKMMARQLEREYRLNSVSDIDDAKEREV